METPDATHDGTDAPGARWRRMRRLSFALLFVWAGVGFGLVWFARALNRVVFLGWPLGYWVAAQGALLTFLALVVGYAWAADRKSSSARANRSG